MIDASASMTMRRMMTGFMTVRSGRNARKWRATTITIKVVSSPRTNMIWPTFIAPVTDFTSASLQEKATIARHMKTMPRKLLEDCMLAVLRRRIGREPDGEWERRIRCRMSHTV
ncbi:hypothetical protein D3C86_1702170 [compost metagenome]